MSKRSFGDRLLYGVCIGIVLSVLLLGLWGMTFEVLQWVYKVVITS
jgi:uncharacterized membrane protein YgaE (UPF0421/DUF939 family)